MAASCPKVVGKADYFEPENCNRNRSRSLRLSPKNMGKKAETVCSPCSLVNEQKSAFRVAAKETKRLGLQGAISLNLF